jgi:hypothetical protein
MLAVRLLHLFLLFACSSTSLTDMQEPAPTRRASEIPALDTQETLTSIQATGTNLMKTRRAEETKSAKPADPKQLSDMLRPTPGTAVVSTATVDPCTGWSCTIDGTVYVDTAQPGNELDGVNAKMNHFSYCSPTRGEYHTTTASGGTFQFDGVFFHDTDRLWIEIEFEGYELARWDSVDLYCLYCSCFSTPIEIVLRTESNH